MQYIPYTPKHFLVCVCLCVYTCDKRLRAMDRLPRSVCFALFVSSSAWHTQGTQDNRHMHTYYKHSYSALNTGCKWNKGYRLPLRSVLLQERNCLKHVFNVHNYRCKICCLVTHYIALLHHPRLYLGVYMGALSPVKGTWLPLWVPCPP